MQPLSSDDCRLNGGMAGQAEQVHKVGVGGEYEQRLPQT
jgi:hypothetical protein